MNEASWKNINLTQSLVEENLKILSQDFADKVAAAYADRPAFEKSLDVEEQLYDGFVDDKDRKRIDIVRKSNEQELADFHPDFVDERLPELLLRYKARWFPKSLSGDEQLAWENYRQIKLRANAPKYQELIANLLSSHQEKNQQFLLEELRLWLEYTALSDS
jgi:exodeoxyribonuclease-1